MTEENTNHTFKGRDGQSWQLVLDPVLVMEIKTLHGVNLSNLESDPLLKLRVDPMILVAVIALICAEQIKEQNLTPEGFARQLPFPSDDMLKAITAAIVNFFPTGRASHVAEVLTGYEQMGATTDTMTTEKMKGFLQDPAIRQKISERADREILQAVDKLTSSPLTT